MRKIDGRKAEVINTGKFYTTYRSFANKHGYPDAAVEYDSIPSSRTPHEGSVVTLLVSGEHENNIDATIWVIETEEGEHFLINEVGLRILDEGVTVLKDESLGGVEREYREVKRKALDGDRVIYKNVGRVATCFTRIVETPHETWTSTANGASDMYVLEQTDIVRINGERLRMVDRKAAVGERVIVVNPDYDADEFGDFKTGDTAVVTSEKTASYHVFYLAEKSPGKEIAVYAKEYRVLEPVEIAETAEQPQPLSAKPAPDQAAEIIAKLTGRVGALERRVAALETAPINPRSSDLEVTVQVATDAFAKAAQRASVTVAEVTANLAQRAKEARQRKRDDIVRRAKDDVERLVDEDGFAHRRGGPFNTVVIEEFVVNSAKRTVVVLGFEAYGNRKKRALGIAKCAPGDVFNANLGRAISLRRALGLEIPEEYVSAPNPTEVRVGDVVDECGGYDREARVVDAVRPSGYAAADEGLTFEGGGWAFIHECKIIDDSRESDSAEPRKEVA